MISLPQISSSTRLKASPLTLGPLGFALRGVGDTDALYGQIFDTALICRSNEGRKFGRKHRRNEGSEKIKKVVIKQQYVKRKTLADKTSITRIIMISISSDSQ